MRQIITIGEIVLAELRCDSRKLLQQASRTLLPVKKILMIAAENIYTETDAVPVDEEHSTRRISRGLSTR